MAWAQVRGRCGAGRQVSGCRLPDLCRKLSAKLEGWGVLELVGLIGGME